MKDDFNVEIGMVRGIMQQAGFFSKNAANDNPQESFDAIFENSFQKSEEQRNYVNSRDNDRNHEKRVESRSEKSDGHQTVNDSAESGRNPQATERQEKPATSDADYETEEENVQETTAAVNGTQNSDGSDEAAQIPDETVNTSMESIQAEIKLDDEQLSALCNLLGITLVELAQMKIEVTKGSEESIKATFPDGTEIDLGKILQLEENGKLLKGEEAVKKLAALLNIDEDQAESFVKKLGIKSIEIFGGHANQQGANKNKSQTPFFTGKAAESKVVEDSERKITIDSKGENLKQSVEQAKGDVKADTAQVKSEFGAAIKEAASQRRTGNTAKADHAVSIGGKTTSESPTQIADIKETARTAAHSRVFSQIVERAKILSLPNRTEARITLTPANLGTVDIKIIVQDAQVKGSILVDNQQVKRIVEQNINSLKTALAEQGINVDEISVDINDRNTKFDQQNATGKDSDKNLSRHYAGDGDRGISDQVEQETDIEEIRRAMRNKILDVTA
jgi:flagellar hook-length control protein FliK